MNQFHSISRIAFDVYLRPYTGALLLSCVFENLGRLVGHSEVDVKATPKGVAWSPKGRLEQVVDFVISSESGGKSQGGGYQMASRTLSDVRMPLVSPS